MGLRNRISRGITAALQVEAPAPAPVSRESKTDSAPEMVSHRDSGGSAMYNSLTGSGLAGADAGSSISINCLRTSLMPWEAVHLYRYSGISRRIIDIVPDNGTRAG